MNSFSKSANNAEIKTIDPDTRTTIAKEIEGIKTCDGTCLPCGLENGLDVRLSNLSICNIVNRTCN